MIASSRPHCALCPKTATAQITLLRCFERNYRDRYANAVVACNASRGRLLPGFGPFEIVSTHDNKCAGSNARLRFERLVIICRPTHRVCIHNLLAIESRQCVQQRARRHGIAGIDGIRGIVECVSYRF